MDYKEATNPKAYIDFFKNLYKVTSKAETDGNVSFDTVWDAIEKYQNSIRHIIVDFHEGTLHDDDLEFVVVQAFGSQVCAKTIMDKPVLLTTNFAKELMKDRQKSADSKKEKAKYHDLLRQARHDYYGWFKFPDSYNNANKAISTEDVSGIVAKLNTYVIRPILGITGYRPSNVKQAIKEYQEHKKINQNNDNLCNNISISDQLDNNQDRNGLSCRVWVDKAMEQYCLDMLKHKKFNHVIDPKNLTKSYL